MALHRDRHAGGFEQAVLVAAVGQHQPAVVAEPGSRATALAVLGDPGVACIHREPRWHAAGLQRVCHRNAGRILGIQHGGAR
ncbi:hypothetical protein, partial [Methylibium sp.]|uniref:hypothetical protein n=1 Tax=Methylibium sp. TaxID=2067992 RepID=UPI0025FC67AC